MQYLQKYEDKIFNSVIPAAWELVRLEEVCRTITDGTHNTPNYLDKGIRFISIKNIRPFQPINWESYEKYISQEEHEELIKRCKPEYDDILFPRIGTLGFGKRIDFEEEVSIFVGLGLLKPIKEAVLPKFLEYWMNHPFIFKISHEKATGSGRLTLPLAESRKLPLPLPPFNEQLRIVAKIEELFSELDKGVESLNTARVQLKVYRQALLKHAFEGKLTERWRAEHADQLETTDQLLARIKKEREERYQEQLAEWEKDVDQWRAKGEKGKKPSKPQKIKKVQQLSKAEIEQLPVLPKSWGWTTLGELVSGKARSMQSGPFGSNLKHSEFTSQGVLVIGIDNVLEGKFSLGSQNRITKKKFEELKKYQARPKDLLMTVMASLGRTCVVPKDLEDAIITKHVYRITMEEKLLSTEFYNLLLQSHSVSRKRMFENAQGQTRPGLNSTILRELPVPLCDLSEQQEIVSLLSDKLVELDRFEFSIDSEITKTTAIRQSILKKAFSGELVSQDPNDEPASELLARMKAEREEAQQQAKIKPREAKKKKEVITMADLIEVIRDAKDWMNAQEVFRKCGIADGAETDAIERIYEELRVYVKENKIAVERRGEEDWLRLAQGA